MRTRGKMPPATKKSKRRRDMAKEIKRGSEPSHLLCTITGLMFRDPVCVFPGGQTYDRPAISTWMSKGGTDPLMKTEICEIVTNWALRNCIQDWLDTHDKTPEGWDSRDMFAPFEKDIHALAGRGELTAINSFMNGLDEMEKKRMINLEINGETPISCALESEECSVELIDAILNYGADVSKMYYSKADRIAFHPRLKKNIEYAILHKAACYCDAPVIERILREPQVDKMVQASDGSLPFMWAAERDNLEAVIILVRDFDAFDHNDEHGVTALHQAASMSILEVLLTKAKSAWNDQARFENFVNARNHEGNTPLHRKTLYGDINIAQYLVEAHGAKYEIENAAGETALMHGIRSEFNDYDIKKGLLRLFCECYGMEYPTDRLVDFPGGLHHLMGLRDIDGDSDEDDDDDDDDSDEDDSDEDDANDDDTVVADRIREIMGDHSVFESNYKSKYSLTNLAASMDISTSACLAGALKLVRKDKALISDGTVYLV